MRDNRRREYDVDEIMKKALISDAEPDVQVNRRIMQNWKESAEMKRNAVRKIYMAAAAAACVLLVTVTAGAAARYLRTDEVAERTENATIADAFKGENATEINESGEAGDYRFTLMGITTADRLSQLDESGPSLTAGSTYVVMAVERLDGTPMPSTQEEAYNDLELFISPLIQGLTPWQYNMASMGGEHTTFVEDGVLYRVIGCDDVSMFADRKLYLCVIDDTFYDTNAYHYDEATGLIARNESYQGINLLFELPIDSTKADPDGAAQYLKELEASWEPEETPDESTTSSDSDTAKMVQELWDNEEEVLKDAVLMEEYTRTVTAKDGVYAYSFGTESEMWSMLFYETGLKDGKDYLISNTGFNEQTGQSEGIYIIVLNKTGDNTAEIRVYHKTQTDAE